MNDEVVTRLYRCLAEELRRRGHSDDRPVKVSQLYQELVPYRAVRSTLGVELNADYEHALLRLLAGERGLLRLEPDEARDELRREVEAPYPFVGMFRKFAASDVWVSMQAAPGADSGAGADGDADAEEARGMKDGARDRDGDRSGRLGPRAPRDLGRPEGAAPVAGRGGPVPARSPAPVQLHRDHAPADPTERPAPDGAACDFCGEHLPAGRRVRFCPHCGGDQRLRSCPRCEAVLERAWHYCISCGHDVSDG